MHPEILSLSLFMFVTSCSPGPNNIVASHSGFNHGIKKSIPLILGSIDEDGKVVLVHPSQKVENGLPVA